MVSYGLEKRLRTTLVIVLVLSVLVLWFSYNGIFLLKLLRPEAYGLAAASIMALSVHLSLANKKFSFKLGPCPLFVIHLESVHHVAYRLHPHSLRHELCVVYEKKGKKQEFISRLAQFEGYEEFLKDFERLSGKKVMKD
jgi:hypothetical protein